jgi:hypothetical protein
MITPQPTKPLAPNGPAAAAILSAAIACFTLGLTTLASDRSPAINKFMNFYPPAGALTGETTIAILLWLLVWIALARLWRTLSLSLRSINIAAFLLLLLGLLLTFPPFIDLL